MARETEEIQEVVRLGGLSMTELVKRVVKRVYEDNAIGQAAQLAYYFLFALFPFLLFLTTLLGFLPLAIGAWCLGLCAGRRGWRGPTGYSV